MKSAQDLQDLVDQAYTAFKSNAKNVAQVNAAFGNIMAIAEAAAKNGSYSCDVDLGNLTTQNIANIELFKRYLAEQLNNNDLFVSFADSSSYTAQQNWVTVSWLPDNE